MVATRTIRHRDGRWEIVRVLSTSDLAHWNQNEPLSYEKSIVWLENIERLPYVRVAEVRCATSRRGALVLNGKHRVIGYSKLMDDAPRDPHTARFTRRLFYLKEGDGRSQTLPAGQAVDPRTVFPGLPGESPETK